MEPNTRGNPIYQVLTLNILFFLAYAKSGAKWDEPLLRERGFCVITDGGLCQTRDTIVLPNPKLRLYKKI